MGKQFAKVPARYNTSKMMFDPNKTGFTDSFRTKIKSYSAINKKQLGINERSMCEYIALMYDMNSPLWLEVPDYFQRKYEAAVAAGFKVNTKGHFEPPDGS